MFENAFGYPRQAGVCSRHWHSVAALVIGVGLAGLGCGGADPSGPSDGPSDHTTSAPASKRQAADATNRGKADWGFDICSRNSWYGDRACDWFCPRHDSDCSVDPIGPEPSGQSTRYPIVLAHGFMGSDTNFWSFNDVPDALRADGHIVFETEVPPFNSVADRGDALADQVDVILAQTGADKVNLVAHSMGGLDCRYVTSTLGYADRVASVSTIGTPHRGSRIADVYLDLMPQAADRAVDALAKLAGGSFSAVADQSDVRAAMVDIAESNADGFNAANPDQAGVYYQSWAGVSSVAGIRVGGIDQACDGKVLLRDGTMDHMHSLLWPSAALVAGSGLTLNDGMVSVESAKWGHFEGCIPADHLDEVGQIGHEEINTNTGLDHIRFYRNLAYGLAGRGF